jgi:hypothetical protein
MEVAHLGFVRLILAYRDCFLFHAGTGELVRLDGKYSLHFDAQHAGFLQPMSDESAAPRDGVTWLQTSQGGPLRLSLHKTSSDPPREFILDSVLKTSQWVDAIRDQHVPRAWSHVSASSGDLCALAAWHYTLPVGDSHIMWELSSLQTGLLGSCARTTWIHDNSSRWQKDLTDLGFGSAFRKGHKGFAASARKNGTTVDPTTLASSTTEPLCNTIALVEIAVRSAQGHHRRGLEEQNRAERWLWAFIDSFLGRVVTSFSWKEGDMLVELVVNEGFVELEVAKVLLGHTAKNPCTTAAIEATRSIMTLASDGDCNAVHRPEAVRPRFWLHIYRYFASHR